MSEGTTLGLAPPLRLDVGLLEVASAIPSTNGLIVSHTLTY